eukprot:TRINITY_DN9824_c0_g1_i3.p1 TRINITY_DN9824_c0_g1~~TRINITY_DN9824_c0_g1_i3.p1  ORF type:complete len:483 (-),score=116.84 TRINITY_DN9824_c0_g1_i3:39-1487(-)
MSSGCAWRVALVLVACGAACALGQIQVRPGGGRGAAQAQGGALDLDYYVFAETSRLLWHIHTIDGAGEANKCQLPASYGTPKTVVTGFGVVVTVDAALGLHRINPITCEQVGPTIALPAPVDFITEVWEGTYNYGSLFVAYILPYGTHVLHRVDIADGMDEANLRNLPSEDLVCSASDVLWCTTLESGSNYVYTIPPAGGVPTLISESIGESLGFDEYGNLNELVNQEVEPDTTPITIYRLNPSDGMWDEVYTIIGLPIDTYTLLGFDRNVISACVPNCAGKSCGENSGCNTPCDVESCTGVDAYCDAFVCVTSVQPCTPDCVGKGCGADDGCSGTCDADETCTQYPNSFCNGVACDCAPSCVGQCGGDNGCGGVCPDCGETDVCWTASTADACAALACEWCTLWEDGGQSYGQCLGGGECAEVHALCGSGAEGFGCIYGDVDHFVWCTADWFKGMMQCPPGTACDAAPYVLSGNFTCSYVL